MPEEILFKSEQRMDRSEIAAALRQVADNLSDGSAITLSAGGDSVTLDPPQQVTFEVKAEREGPPTGAGEFSVEFELEWPENAEDDGPLQIE